MKLVIFDLDGVLVDTKIIHYNALNDALKNIEDKYIISWEEHIKIYDGLKTNEKLDILSKNKGLSKTFHNQIWKDKQEATIKYLSNIKENLQLIETLSNLAKDGYKIACCSNSIKKTVLYILSKLNIIHFFDIIISNEDVKNSKPYPDMYWQAMSFFGILPEETLIIEDSPHGLLGANRSGANVMRVLNSLDTTYYNIIGFIKNMDQKNFIPKWVDKNLNILIPMAGAGSRFEKAGYTFPKPLIDVNGKPMIQQVVESLNIEGNYIYVVQKSHREKYNLDAFLNLITPNCKIVEVDGMTEGAACTALLAKELINTQQPLFFANSDQYVEWNSNEFMYKMQEMSVDGGILTFESTHPKWSFAKIDEFGFVQEVAEKKPISNIATVGLYYWKNGSDFVKYAEQMIKKNIRVNNEFYVCPVFNQAIEDNKKIKTVHIDNNKFWGLGTPEDLQSFLRAKKYVEN